MNGFDCVELRDAVDAAFGGLDCTVIFPPVANPEEFGRSSAGDWGGVFVGCEKCCKRAIDVVSSA